MVARKDRSLHAGKSNASAKITKSSAAKSIAVAKGANSATSQAKKARRTVNLKSAAGTFSMTTLKIVEPTAFVKGRSRKAPSQDEVSRAAKVVRAQKELLHLVELRLIHQAAKAKTSQSAIAALLGTSQPTVSRIAKQIKQNPSILEPSPSEIINRRAVGQINTDAMMSTLLSYAYIPGQYDPSGGDGFLRGNWRQIESALITGLITDEEYERIARGAPTAKPARAAR